MKIRSLEEVIEYFRSTLVSVGSSLSNFNPYTNVYAIFRSIASVITEQDVKLNTVFQNFYILTATGDYLDAKALDYGLYRSNGNYSRGYVLVKGTDALIPQGLVLSSPNQSLQFRTVSSIRTSDSVERAILVEGLTKSTESNLPAGTKLYAATLPGYSFTIGRYRDSLTLSPVGALENGSSRETDEDFRARILARLRGTETGTKSAIMSAIKDSPYGSRRMYIQEHTPITGYFTIFIDSSDSEFIEGISQIVNQVKAAGVAFLIRPIKIRSVIVRLAVDILSIDAVATVQSQAQNIINELNSRLTINKPLYKDSIVSSLSILDRVKSIKLIEPIGDVVPNNSELIVIEDIQFTFNSY